MIQEFVKIFSTQTDNINVITDVDVKIDKKQYDELTLKNIYKECITDTLDIDDNTYERIKKKDDLTNEELKQIDKKKL